MFSSFKERMRRKEFEKELKEKKQKEKEMLERFYKEYPNIKEIKLIDERTFYDTTWQITLFNDEIVKIIRRDDEKIDTLCQTIKNLKIISKKSLLSLDEKDKIYYD